MATMKNCMFNSKVISVDEAIDIRDSGRIAAPDFRCTECNQSVRPHRAGGHVAAHFEHLERNPDCSQSYISR